MAKKSGLDVAVLGRHSVYARMHAAKGKRARSRQPVRAREQVAMSTHAVVLPGETRRALPLQDASFERAAREMFLELRPQERALFRERNPGLAATMDAWEDSERQSLEAAGIRVRERGGES